MWQRWVIDVGITGPDKGEGGKYLFLPPGYKGSVPSGYHVVRSPTFGLWIPWRSFLVRRQPQAGRGPRQEVSENISACGRGQEACTAELRQHVGQAVQHRLPADYAFWELLNQVVQEEPTESLDQIRLGFFQWIGIQKGKPFAPDERMKKILTEAAAVGDATARANLFQTREKAAYYYPNSNWQLGFIGGYNFQTQPGVLNFDAANFYYFLAILVTPAMEEKMIGKGSQYAWTARDANGQPLDGAKSYKLRMQANVPVKDFWSVILYSDQTRSMIQTDQRFPSVSSQTKGLQVNPRWLHQRVLLVPRRRPERKRTGCRRCRAAAGTRCCACTARSSPGSTRPGGRARSNCSLEHAAHGMIAPLTRNKGNNDGTLRHHLFYAALASAIAIAPATGNTQMPGGAPKYAPDVPAKITATRPNTVTTRIGTLRFKDGAPDPATVQLAYDQLDFGRGVDAFLKGMSATSVNALCQGFEQAGIKLNQGIGISEDLLDARSLFLTANTTTIYVVMCIDLKDGPMVVRVPPRVLGPVDDADFRWVTDVGFTRAGQGRG